MGSISTVGKLKPNFFYHFLINNHVHESVGGQATSANIIDFLSLVKSNGYQSVLSADSKIKLKKQIHYLINRSGPNFLEILINPGSRKDLGRPNVNPIDNKSAFMKFIK